MLSIKNNLMSGNAARHLGASYDALAQSVERLSSGQRINSAKDDAAGMAVGELVRSDVATLQQGARNAQDAISMLQTADGALGVVDDILIRMKELAEQAATDSYSSDQRAIMDNEFSQLSAEIDRIADNTAFNGQNLLNATQSLNIHVGSSTMIAISTSDLTSAGLGIGAVKAAGTWSTWTSTPGSWVNVTTAGTLTFKFQNQSLITANLSQANGQSMTTVKNAINSASRSTTEAYDAAQIVYDAQTGMSTLQVSGKTGGAQTLVVAGTAVTNIGLETQANYDLNAGSGTAQSLDTAGHARTALGIIDDAIVTKDNYRASLGYLMNRLQNAANVVGIQAENLSTAQSRIVDVDVATEMSKLTTTQVLAQAGVAMLAQANSMPQMAVKLIG